MIPKVIHYCWLSQSPLPESMQRYVDTWRKAMPDYELRLWDFNTFPKEKCQWVAEAFDAKKYAFAADYIRCYALYNFGGIYLDCDVEAVKPFDDLLHLPYALGFENGTGCIEAAVMATEPGNEIYKHMLDYYDEKKHFVNADGSFNDTPLPRLLRDVAVPPLKVIPIDSPQNFDRAPEHLSVLPFDYFSPIHLEHRELQSTDRTYAIHHFAASWQSGWKKRRDRIKRLLGPRLTRLGIAIKRALFGRSKE